MTQENLQETLKWNADGLIPVIAQQHDTRQVLMLAWMNREALEKTMAERRMWYYSRSRRALWQKGETSGHTQALIELHLDCDGDTILALIDQTGAACHTGQHTCFYRKMKETGDVATLEPVDES